MFGNFSPSKSTLSFALINAQWSGLCLFGIHKNTEWEKCVVTWRMNEWIERTSTLQWLCFVSFRFGTLVSARGSKLTLKSFESFSISMIQVGVFCVCAMYAPLLCTHQMEYMCRSFVELEIRINKWAG